ncbi:helix-turn-helix transcriptional regulator [Streptomyces sp. BI20]|uniref:helix-turn-helix transcriptional regulator n=1 Tax=Streptomyces sp. BI20 TaxID=3403460 RepID=UPI003C731D1B
MLLSERRIVVSVYAGDPLSRAGVMAQIGAGGPGWQVGSAEGFGGEPDGQGAVSEGATEVAVVACDRLDGEGEAVLREAVGSRGRPVVLVVGALRESDLVTLVEAGIGAVVWRHEATADALRRAVERAGRGEGDLPPDLITRLLTRLGRPRLGDTGVGGSREAAPEKGAGGVRGRGRAALAPVLGLAGREADVLRLIADGLDTRQVAERLAYSERTVKNVLHQVMTRLRLRNRAHAVAYAVREGWI